MSYRIRKAESEDMNAVLDLITELAVFENEPDAVHITSKTLIQYGTGSQPLFTCFVAEDDSEILGAAIVYFRFSTWEGKSLHLEDLIVSKEHRSKGLGKALYNQVMRYASEQDVNRVEWVVLDWNKNAIDFYERNGATLLKDWYLAQINKQGLSTYIKSLDK